MDKQLFDKIIIEKGDITTCNVDAIVNAAAPHLLGGGGVDGCIHRAAGPKLKEECITLGGCKIGHAKMTKAYNLPCSHVIHTVGPVYDNKKVEEQKQQLKSCYDQCFLVAAKHKIGTLALPCIANGIYGFPLRLSIPIVFDSVVNALKNNSALKKVHLVCFKMSDYEQYVDYFLHLKEKIDA